MGQFEQMVIVGISMSFILSIMILGSTYYNPRLWLNDYPKDIQKVVLPKSINEKTNVLFRNYLQYYSLRNAFSFYIYTTSPWKIIVYWGLFTYFWDCNDFQFSRFINNRLAYILLDYSRFVVIPSTEEMKGYKDYKFHLRGAIAGTPFLAIVSLFWQELRQLSSVK